VVSTLVVIAPPTGVTITAGLNTPTPVGSGVWVQFTVQGCGPYLAGTAQEFVYNKVLYSVQQPPDPAWTPPSGQPASVFYFDGGIVWDYKITNNTANFQNWTFQSTFYTSTQSIRMIFTDPCGVTRTYPIGTVNLARFKIDDSTWQLLQR
jgi:hypothetical protein